LKFINSKNIKSFNLTIGNISIIVNRKRIKYLRMSVSNSDGSVKISAPLKTSNKIIEEFVLSRLEWIEKHQKKFQTKTKPKLYKYESGEIHFFKAKPYQLEIRYEEKKPSVLISEENIILIERPGSSMEKRKKFLDEWYRVYLKEKVPELIKKWAPVVGDSPLDWGIKNMKTRWGSCNTRDKRIWLSLKLAEKSESCLEYEYARLSHANPQAGPCLLGKPGFIRR